MRAPQSLDDISRLIDSLYASTGLRLNVVDRLPVASASMDNIQLLCDFVTSQMQLPVRVRIEQTLDMVNRGAPAEVCIPSNLPQYSDPALVGFEVLIRVAEVYDDPYHTLTLLSHEFAHIYLHSRRDPLRESEYATDLCALMMGFGPIWTKGRTNFHKEHRGWMRQSVMYYHTLGYLTDEQYLHACQRIDSLRAAIGSKRAPIIHAISRIRSGRDYLYALLRDAPGSGYAGEVRRFLASTTERVNQFLRAFNAKRTFREQDKRWLDECAQWLALAESRMAAARARLEQDPRMPRFRNN